MRYDRSKDKQRFAPTYYLRIVAARLLSALVVGLLCAGAVAAEGPRITASTVQEIMGRVVVTYTLEGSRAARVRLQGLLDGTVALRTRAVSGDVGEGVSPGVRALHWDIPADHPGGLGDKDVSLSLLAEPVDGAGVVFLPVRGLFGVGFTEQVLSECLEAVSAEEVQVLVAEFDSPGGDPVVAEAAADRLSAWRRGHPNVLVVAYVNQEASGVAALFAGVFDEIYLSPGATFGGPTAAEDAELLAGAKLGSTPGLQLRAQGWADTHGVPRPVRDALFHHREPSRYTGQEAIDSRIAAGLAGDRRELGKLLHYSAWEDRSERVAQTVAARGEAVRAAVETYDSLAALIDAELQHMEQETLGPAKQAAYLILELTEEFSELREEFPFVEGLFNQEFPGGVAAVTQQCQDVTGEAPEIVSTAKVNSPGKSTSRAKRNVRWTQVRRKQRSS